MLTRRQILDFKTNLERQKIQIVENIKEAQEHILMAQKQEPKDEGDIATLVANADIDNRIIEPVG